MIKKQLKKSAQFYLAEDVRLDQENKAMLIGLYPANKVIITLPEGMTEISQNKGVMLPGLSILINVSGFSGVFQTKVSLYTPSGFPLMENNELGEIEITPDNRYNSSNLVARFFPFRVIELGMHKFVVQINKSRFEYEFSIVT